MKILGNSLSALFLACALVSCAGAAPSGQPIDLSSLKAGSQGEGMVDIGNSRLKDTAWRVEKLAPTIGAYDWRIVKLSFPDGKVSGMFGCNRFSGSGTVNEAENELDFGVMAGTRMMCFGDRMEIEDIFVKIIGNVFGYKLSDSELVLNYRAFDSHPAGSVILRPSK